MKATLTAIAVLGLCSSSAVEAAVYQSIGAPLGSLQGRSYVSLGEAHSAAAAKPGGAGIANLANRPSLPGVRPVEVELLQDALGRKYHRRIGNSIEKANESIIRNGLRDSRKRAHIKGILAEALYLERNPTWEYVPKSNAPQVDVFQRVPGRRPVGAQIKTHISSDPTTYARDMLRDHRADVFLVPDDHVSGLKTLWRERLRDAKARGAVTKADAAQRQLDRIGGLGFTSKELDDRFTRANRYALRERNAGYVSLGAALAIAIGPGLLEWWRTGSVTEQTTQQAVRAASILAAERATTWSLARIGGGSLKGGLRGNLITGTAIFVTDFAWTMYEHGGTRAFRSADFYSRLGGSIGGLAVGMTIGSVVTVNATLWTAPIFGGLAPAVGAIVGFASGAVAGTVGYAGGDFAARQIMSAVNPDFLHKAEDEAIAAARAAVASQLRSIQDPPVAKG